MQVTYVKSESTQKPDLLDNTSSSKVTYIRRNIKDLVDEENDIIRYEYEEAKLTKEQYEQYLKEMNIADIEQQRADIDYIALMLGIDLEA